MKIAALTMIRHDGDIIEEFIRHTATVVDEILIYNNVSLDASTDIIRALQDEGLPVSITECDILADGRDAEWTDIVRDAWTRTDAQFLALLDADEFVVFESRAQFEAELAALPADHHATLTWKNYVPTAIDPPDEPRTLARIQFRQNQEPLPEQKVVLSRSFELDAKLRVMLGSHGVVGANTRAIASAHIAHFPVRSVEQIQAKTLLGRATFIVLGLVGRGTLGFQWGRLYAELERSSSWTARDLVDYGQSYFRRDHDVVHGPWRLVRDPLQPVARRYSQPPMSLLEVAIAVTHQLAETLARVSEQRRTRSTELAAAQAVQLASRVDRLTEAIERVADERDGLRRDVQHISAERDMLLAYIHQIRSSEHVSSDGAARHGTPQREPDRS